ncbi:hypothetical protein D6C78_10782 [Aureobasidium pullulans]|uniref:Ubiquitin 3 binding protein But2 C-terminal domain-containing protein n=1 Tax=Aureobasidium pullulans TaxID=5580 RepID=A0A4V4LCT7_AURPU|nr:hypothetical protein D6D08_10588 [Aureobasidium pullulans]TIA28367.1 hypothetical protein D6C78_10782 [Aureobasidium pullulans]CAD0056130.1 unnamed protein product [Aureobasidium pullulans]
MRIKQINHSWIALLSFAGSAVSETAECGDGVELSIRQGDRSTFSIPLNETCSAALITFSDDTDLMLNLRTNSSCPYTSSEAQTFTTVIGSDAPEGVATLTFQCNGQVYCMSIDVVTTNISDSQTSIHSVCANLTDPVRESLGTTAGVTRASGVGNGSMHDGSMGSSTTVSSNQSQALRGNSSITTALLSASTGFSTIRGASVLGNDADTTSLNSLDGGQFASLTRSAVSVVANLTTTTMSAAFVTGTPSLPISQALMASSDRNDTTMPTKPTVPPSDSDTTISPTATSLLDGDDATLIGTANQSPAESQFVGSNSTAYPTAPAMAAQSLGNGTSMDLPTQATGQDPSTCACYPLPTL